MIPGRKISYTRVETTCLILILKMICGCIIYPGKIITRTTKFCASSTEFSDHAHLKTKIQKSTIFHKIEGKNQTFQFSVMFSLEMAIELVERILELVVNIDKISKVKTNLRGEFLIRNWLT